MKMKKIYFKPETQIDILASAETLMNGGSITTRNTFGGTLEPEDDGKIIPSLVLETESGDDSPYSNGQDIGIRTNSGLWED